jgi:hypothetical protein
MGEWEILMRNILTNTNMDWNMLYATPLSERKGFWEIVSEQYNAAEPPTGFQGMDTCLLLLTLVNFWFHGNFLLVHL